MNVTHGFLGDSKNNKNFAGEEILLKYDVSFIRTIKNYLFVRKTKKLFLMETLLPSIHDIEFQWVNIFH